MSSAVTSLADAFTKTPEKTTGKRKRVHVLKPVPASVVRNLVVSERQRGYVTRAFPSPNQGSGLARAIGMGRYMWNWMLGTQEAAYAEGVCLTGPAGDPIK